MTVGLYKAQVVLTAKSLLPEDAANNVLYFVSTDGGSSEADDADYFTDTIINFFNDVHPGATVPIAEFIGDQVHRGSLFSQILFYRKDSCVDAGDWGSPVEMRSWTIDAAGVGSSLPAEVACCMSFHGDLTNIPETAPNPTPPPAIIRPAARRRGRIYLGPLQVASGAEDSTSGDLLPNSSFRNAIVGGGVSILTRNTLDYTWVVHSEAEAACHAVTGGYVDYAYDTQRRRGTAPIARQTFPQAAVALVPQLEGPALLLELGTRQLRTGPETTAQRALENLNDGCPL